MRQKLVLRALTTWRRW